MNNEINNDIITLIDEEGNEVEFELVMSIEANEHDYAILAPVEETEEDEAYIFRIEYDDLADVLVPQHRVNPRGADIFGV